MKFVRISAVTTLFLLFALQTLAGTGSGLVEKNVAAKVPVPVVCMLDNVTSIGGHRPTVLGTPKLADATRGGPALQFDGQNDGLLLWANPLRRWAKFTIEALFLPEADSPPAQRFLHIQDERDGRVTLETRSSDGNSWSLDAFLLCGENHRVLLDRTKLHPVGKWSWVALVYDGNKMMSYVNGVKELEGKLAFAPMTDGRMSLGVRLNRVSWFKGCIKEVRFTPAPLAPEALQRLIAE
jgi:hypothetical protein